MKTQCKKYIPATEKLNTTRQGDFSCASLVVDTGCRLAVAAAVCSLEATWASKRRLLVVVVVAVVEAVAAHRQAADNSRSDRPRMPAD